MNPHSDISTFRIELKQTMIKQQQTTRANFHYKKRERLRIKGKFRLKK